MLFVSFAGIKEKYTANTQRLKIILFGATSAKKKCLKRINKLKIWMKKK